MADTDHTQNTVPAAAKQLGALGVIPFLGLAIAAVLGSGAWVNDALVALLAYGAVILSFLEMTRSLRHKQAMRQVHR